MARMAHPLERLVHNPDELTARANAAQSGGVVYAELGETEGADRIEMEEIAGEINGSGDGSVHELLRGRGRSWARNTE
jgi:predicted chitinase